MYAASAVPIMPVSVQVTDLSPYRFAATVEDLMGMLLSDRWPEKASPVYRSAVARCIDAISMQSDGDKARGAFVNAAHDAGIAVSPDDDRLIPAAPIKCVAAAVLSDRNSRLPVICDKVAVRRRLRVYRDQDVAWLSYLGRLAARTRRA
jgi:hypothetical protein